MSYMTNRKVNQRITLLKDFDANPSKYSKHGISRKDIESANSVELNRIIKVVA